MKRIIGFICCLFGSAMLVLYGILWSLECVGTDAELYYELQMQAGILETTGVSETDLLRLDELLATYLRGDTHILDIQVEVFGEKQWAFNQKEASHLEDCQNLFDISRMVKKAAGLFSVCLIFCGVIVLKKRRDINLAFGFAPMLLAIPLGLLAIWAAVDFNSAFAFFHEMLFDNDLWLLNTNTDLLIRICPQSMFMNMGIRIGSASLIFAVLVTLTLIALVSILQKKKINDGDVK